jgi:hypothetical protein
MDCPLRFWPSGTGSERPSNQSRGSGRRRPLRYCLASRAIGSAGEHLVHTEEVTGSIPVSPTTHNRRSAPVSAGGFMLAVSPSCHHAAPVVARFDPRLTAMYRRGRRGQASGNCPRFKGLPGPRTRRVSPAGRTRPKDLSSPRGQGSHARPVKPSAAGHPALTRHNSPPSTRPPTSSTSTPAPSAA